MFGRKKRQALRDRVNTIAERHPQWAGEELARMPRQIAVRAERAPSFADCTVYYAGLSHIGGVIVDYSATGARVRFRHRHALPERVRIVCPRLDIDRQARVVRRLDFDVGLQFID